MYPDSTLQRPPSAIVADTPANKPRLDEQSAPFSEQDLNQWLTDETLLERAKSAQDPELRLYRLIQAINERKPGTLQQFFGFAAIEAFLQEQPYLKDLIEAGNFKGVILSNVLWAHTKTTMTIADASRQAAEDAWHAQYHGDTNALYTILKLYTMHTNYRSYATRYASFVQSSGTGKSRMNDELAKKILYIPINLSRTTDVFPPSDHAVARLVFGPGILTEEACEHTFLAFLYGLFHVTRQRLAELATGDDAFNEDIDTEQRVTRFASQFRSRMNAGMKFGQHGQYRVEFFDSVIERAQQFRRVSGGATVQDAANALLQLLDPRLASFPLSDKPLVVLCFDESHLLHTTPYGPHNWTPFTVLRRVLHTIVNLPIFTLFVSTMGKLEQFSPLSLVPKAPSSRLMGQPELETYRPFCLTSFDQFAPSMTKVLDIPWTLNQVASTYHIAHLGRPLFGAIYDAGYQTGIVQYAQMKLFRSESVKSTPFTDLQSLACIAVRVPIAFLPSAARHSSVERELVARHLRILLYASTGFNQTITTCPSEPLLAEAACDASVDQRWSDGRPVPLHATQSGPISALLYHLQRSYLDIGTRGDVLAVMLLLDARDRATTYPLPTGIQHCGDTVGDVDALKYDGVEKRRIVTLPLFLKALIGDLYTATCLDSLPATYRTAAEADTPLAIAFKDCSLYFNHFIKPTHFPEVVSRAYLRLAISRGAAIICGDGETGIDVLIPCLHGTELVEERVSAILVQVKNSSVFAADIKSSCFVAMDPFECGVFDADDSEPLPIVRMVFALASEESAVRIPPAADRQSSSPSSFTAYDIWCAGLTEETFGVIQNDTERMHAQALLQAMLHQGDGAWMYTHEVGKSVARGMQPLVSTEKDHWCGWAEL
ncbi:hypothetical protein C8Q74DRAFT_1362378 [Fomes fomentarius]|nr:hypothetical protein C8Q74DRAFT_1362378 [Fomes fomentarius]